MTPKEFAERHTEFSDRWALVTAGTPASFNTMTISWGGLGTLWRNKLVATVYIRPDRYTYKFMEDNDTFTVSFYPEDKHDDLALLGTLSGRDGDKVANTSLTPVQVEADGLCGISFKEAEVTLLCKKIYYDDFNPDNIIGENFYESGIPVHRMYIGKVIGVL